MASENIQNNFMIFMSSADIFFSKSTFSISYFRNTIRVSNSLDPDLCRNCLKRLSVEKKKSWLAKKELKGQERHRAR